MLSFNLEWLGIHDVQKKWRVWCVRRLTQSVYFVNQLTCLLCKTPLRKALFSTTCLHQRDLLSRFMKSNENIHQRKTIFFMPMTPTLELGNIFEQLQRTRTTATQNWSIPKCIIYQMYHVSRHGACRSSRDRPEIGLTWPIWVLKNGLSRIHIKSISKRSRGKFLRCWSVHDLQFVSSGDSTLTATVPLSAANATASRRAHMYEPRALNDEVQLQSKYKLFRLLRTKLFE